MKNKVNWIIGAIVLLTVGILCINFRGEPTQTKTTEVAAVKVPKVEVVQQSILDCRNKTTQLTEFVLNCAKNANPMSDEEGEDLVLACKDTAIDFICIKRIREITSVELGDNKHKCTDSAGVLTTCYTGSPSPVIVND